MHSVFLSFCIWNAVDNLISIPNILFNSFVNFATNCSPLSEIMLSCNSCNFHTLFINNLANLSTNVSFVVATKCAIFDNLLHTTSIIYFLIINSNLMFKSIIKYVHSFSSTSFSISFPASASVYSSFSSITHIHLHITLDLLSFLATNNTLLLTLSYFITLHV